MSSHPSSNESHQNSQSANEPQIRPTGLNDKVQKTAGSFAAKDPQAIEGCPQRQGTSAAPVNEKGPAEEPPKESEKGPLEWNLRVRVKSQEKFWPEDTVIVSLKTIEGGEGTEERHVSMLQQREEIRLNGKGHRKYEVSASVDKWELVEAKTVTLEEGDDKPVELEIRPHR